MVFSTLSLTRDSSKKDNIHHKSLTLEACSFSKESQKKDSKYNKKNINKSYKYQFHKK